MKTCLALLGPFFHTSSGDRVAPEQLVQYSSALPSQFQYFADPTLGGAMEVPPPASALEKILSDLAPHLQEITFHALLALMAALLS